MPLSEASPAISAAHAAPASASCKPVLLLLHDLPGSPDDFAELLPAWQADFRVLSPHWPLEAAALSPEPLWQRYAYAMEALLLTEEAQAWHVLGQGMGAWVALWLAARHAARLQSLSLVALPHGQPGFWQRDWLRFMSRHYVMRWLGPWWLQRGVQQKNAATQARHQRLQALLREPVQRTALSRLWRQYPPQGVAVASVVAQLPLPLLIVVGRHASLAMPQACQQMAAEKAAAQCLVLPCGPAPLLEMPALCGEALQRFWQRTQTPTS